MRTFGQGQLPQTTHNFSSISKIMMFHQSREFNLFQNNPEIEFQTDGA